MSESTQPDLFASIPAALPIAPLLTPHEWPFHGMSGADSFRSVTANSARFSDLLAAIIKREGHALTDKQVKALIPADWSILLGRFAHGHLSQDQAKKCGIICKYVSHDGGGFHFEYTPEAE